ncbi:MAG: RND transporter, partial [Sphingobacteriales bacterium]
LGLFFISLVFIPAVYSFLPAPNTRHTSYLESKWMNKLLDSLSTLVFHNRKTLYIVTIALCAVSVVGMMRLKAVGHIVDDLPHSDKIYTDLKFFEKNFKGVMPLEIIVDTKKKYGAVTSLETWQKLDSLTTLLESRPEIGGGLTLTKGAKFFRQGFTGGAVEDYRLPDEVEFGALKPYMIRMLRKRDGKADNSLTKLMNSFVDSAGRNVRVSVNVADIGSVEMPKLLDEIRPQALQLFDTADYNLTFTGTSITFLEGSKFIINSLRDSLIWAFGMILVCMIVLFRNWRIVLIAVITNIVPLLITAGVMGWLNVPLKPSTVLVFSVALGITVDVTIRFLVNFKQELATHNEDIEMTVRRSIHDTGLSIIFTSLILIAGFAVFAVSEFDGTKSLGYLTSLT